MIMARATVEKEDATINIGGEDFRCSVSCEVEGDYVPSHSGCMRSGSSSHEDLVEPPSPAEFNATEATTSVVVYDQDSTVGTLNLKGTRWFDEWFDDEEVIEKLWN